MRVTVAWGDFTSLGHFCDGAGRVAGIADEIGEADATERIAEKSKARQSAEAGIDFGDSVEMSDCVLRKAGGPAADDGENRGRRWRGRRLRDG